MSMGLEVEMDPLTSIIGSDQVAMKLLKLIPERFPAREKQALES